MPAHEKKPVVWPVRSSAWLAGCIAHKPGRRRHLFPFDVGMVATRIRPPIEVDSALGIPQLEGSRLGKSQSNIRQVERLGPADDRRKDVKIILACQKRKRRSVFRQQEVMITRYASVPNEKPTSSRKPLVSVDPNVEGLARLAASESYKHTLDDMATFAGRINERPQEDLGPCRNAVMWGTVWAEENDGRLGHMD